MASDFRTYDPERFSFRSILNRIHPCCGFSLQKASTIIAIVHMAFSALFAALFLLLIIVFATVDVDDLAKSKLKVEDTTSFEYLKYKIGIKFVILLLLIMTMFMMILFFLSRLLYKGVKERNYRKVDLWWKIILGVTIAIIIQNVITVIKYGRESKIGDFEIFDVLINIYSLWVVYEFRHELQQPSESTVEFDRVLQMP